jgi:hypothetical protein
MLDDGAAAVGAVRGRRALQPHGILVEREFDLRIRQEPERLADVLWDGDLPFARDARR